MVCVQAAKELMDYMMFLLRNVYPAQQIHTSVKKLTAAKYSKLITLNIAQEEGTRIKMDYACVLDRNLSGMEITVLHVSSQNILILVLCSVYHALQDTFMILVHVYLQIVHQLKYLIFFLGNVYVLGIIHYKKMGNVLLVV